MGALEETYWEHVNRATKMGVHLTSVEMQFIFGSQSLKADGLLVDIGANAGRFSLSRCRNYACSRYGPGFIRT